MIAYHNDPSIKAAIIAQLVAHRDADELVKGKYWEDGKGCAVGCTLHSRNHAEYETRFGIPQTLARLEDCTFEGLPNDLAKQWPIRFMTAIRPGADLSLIGWQFLHWLLTDNTVNPGIYHPLVHDAVKQCADIMASMAKNEAAWNAAGSAESAGSAAWNAARSAAWSAGSAARSAENAALSAWSAADSAARSAARSAENAALSAWSAAWNAADSAARSAWNAAWNAADSAARSAAWSARNAADSAAESAARSAWNAPWSAESAAESAARSAAWVAMSNKLIALLEAA